MSTPFDPIRYLRPPRIAVDTGTSLAKMLLTVVPDGAHPGVQLAATRLAEAVATLEAAWSTHGRPTLVRNARAADMRLDRAWGAVHARLASWSVFPDDDPDRRTAEALIERLFPTGLQFLILPFLAEHAQSERRLRIIEGEELRDDLDELVGDVFMEELVQAHAAYGEALNITTPAEPVEPKEPLREPLRELGDAITAYTVQVIAFAGVDEINVEPARRALQPIDDFRTAVLRRMASARGPEDEAEADEGSPESPEPEAAVAATA